MVKNQESKYLQKKKEVDHENYVLSFTFYKRTAKINCLKFVVFAHNAVNFVKKRTDKMRLNEERINWGWMRVKELNFMWKNLRKLFRYNTRNSLFQYKTENFFFLLQNRIFFLNSNWKISLKHEPTLGYRNWVAEIIQ